MTLPLLIFALSRTGASVLPRLATLILQFIAIALAVIAVIMGIFSMEEELGLGIISLMIGILGLLTPILFLGIFAGMA